MHSLWSRKVYNLSRKRIDELRLEKKRKECCVKVPNQSKLTYALHDLSF
jgi:hypothetical protein